MLIHTTLKNSAEHVPLKIDVCSFIPKGFIIGGGAVMFGYILAQVNFSMSHCCCCSEAFLHQPRQRVSEWEGVGKGDNVTVFHRFYTSGSPNVF